MKMEYVKPVGQLFVTQIHSLKQPQSKTWLDWFPEEDWGGFTWSVPYTHKLKRRY